ncbi:MAG: T9SS type A sorting domain-containing protein [Bacteroidetes bacterium]|nr:T9SS type A sorting domain-containing protein [Bacteroidota bacterium]
MKNLLFLLILFISADLSAQIVITSSNNPLPGESSKSVRCDTTGITEGNSGANQTWNYSGIVRLDSTVTNWVSASSTSYAAQFPNSNLASTSDNTSYTFYAGSSSEFLYYGIGDPSLLNSYSNPQTLMQYPFTFGGSFSDVFASTYINGVATSYLNGTMNVSGDAWGTITLPSGTFANALRVKSIRHSTDSSNIGTPFVLEFTSTSYAWFIPNRKLPVFEVLYTNAVLNGSPLGNNKFVFYSPDNPNIGITQLNTNVAENFRLSQNYPNPFNPSTNIRFNIISNERNNNSNVRLVIYDAVGKEIQTLVNQNLSPGSYEVQWNAESAAGGVYYYTLTAGDFTETKKMILIK